MLKFTFFNNVVTFNTKKHHNDGTEFDLGLALGCHYEIFNRQVPECLFGMCTLVTSQCS